MLAPPSLNNISEKKLFEAQRQTLDECQACKEKQNLSEACQTCAAINKILSRYAKANIPVKYWRLKMNQESWLGLKSLLEKYFELTQDLRKTYQSGKSIMFAGSFGIGKTTVCAGILKTALEKGYSAQYLTLNDIVSNFVSSSEDKAHLRNYIVKVDFLVIDEFDPRHIGSEKAADLFGRILEDIVRIRAQNSMPTFFCSNSHDAKNAFQGEIKKSLDSLWNYIEQVTLIGKDLRKDGK